MKNSNAFIKLTSGLLIGGLVLATGSMVFARNMNNSVQKNQMKSMTQDLNIRNNHNVLNELLEKGIITQEQIDTSRTSVQNLMHENRLLELDKNLTKLVENNTITNTQKENILKYFKENIDARQQEMLKLKNLSEQERLEYFKTKINVLDKLIQDEVITKEQSEKICQAISPRANRYISNNQFQKGFNRQHKMK